MANHGSKFVSVNLNKSYGQHHQPSHHANYPHFNGLPAPGRGRPGSGGGGGMLVLSRARGASPKVVPKLSVPPPLNLPSLRKEHEKSDLSGPGGPGAGAGTGSGSRPTSSGMGWTKPVAPATTTALPEKNESVVDFPGVNDGTSAMSGPSRAVGSYMPPSARSGGVGAVRSAYADRDNHPPVDKAVFLRGEDFPSLQAARPVSSGTPQKQKDGSDQKHKHVVREESAQDKDSTNHSGSVADMHPVGRAPRDTTGNRLVENGGKGYGMGSGRMTDQIRKQEDYFLDPLPLVRMNPRSDWADDERDTGRGFVDQGRDTGYSNSESYWDRDFDLPRPSILPHKPSMNQYDNRWGQRDNEAGKRFSSEVLKVDPYDKDVRASSREGEEVNKWRNSPMSKDGFSRFQETGNYRFDAGSRMAGHNNNNMATENKFVSPHNGEMNNNRGQHQHQHQHQSNYTMETFNNNQGADRNPRHVTEQPYNRYRGDNFQTNNSSKPSFASGGKMLHHVADPLLNMGRDKRFSNSDRDFGPAGFDERDLFSEGLVGVIKRKKEAAKSTDFHDPVRESFEAELERVQKMQELERQRIIEEQERALEQAQREEGERLRRIREEDERRRKMEEEAREAAWRAEQERIEAIRRAEELRISREEEKKRIELEEERRKIAAKQKLEELEAKIAMRQADGPKDDAFEKLEVSEKDKNLDLDTWEDSERMVENVMNPGPFDSSSLRTYPREGSSLSFADRGKANNNNNPWKMDGLLEKGSNSIPAPLSDQETSHYSPRRDAFGSGGRGNLPPRKEFYGGPGYMPSRGAYLKPGMHEPYMDEFGDRKDQNRWNLTGNIDPYVKFREMDLEFHDGIADRYGDNSGWGQGQAWVNTHPPYPDRLYPHSEATNDLYNYGRSRYSMRQPRVPPPPSLVSSQRPNPRATEQHTGPRVFHDNDIRYTHSARNDSMAYYEGNQGGLEPSEIFGPQQENNFSEDQNLKNVSLCDSQSSLSVSSPPTSPPHLSHDELDESGESRVTSSVVEEKRNLLTGSESVAHNMVSDNVSAVEDEEWTVENDNTMQMQEEYDEDEDGYREEDEMRERDDENLELAQNFDGLELEESESPHAMDNVVLGFDEGVEVVLPNDDFEKNLETEERSFEIPESSVGILEERIAFDDVHGTNADSSSAYVPEKKSGSQGCIGQHVFDSSDGTSLVTQQLTSSITATSQTNNNMPLSSSQGDLPVKLQFGLFSGPSLIPSPVPAIQIGSIQMPLHNYPPIGQSVTHMHPSQPPIFQLGQLRYTSPISQGILPMAPQSMSYLQPNMLGNFILNQNSGGSVTHEPSRDNVIEVPSLPINNPSSGVSRGQDTVPNAPDEKTKLATDETTKSKSYLPSSKAKTPEIQSQHVQSVGGDRNYSGSRSQGPFSGGRGRRFAYAVKNTNTRVINMHNHGMQGDMNGFQRRPRRTVQRTEFRVRENNDRKPPPVYSNNDGFDDKSNYVGKDVGVFTRSGSKRSTISNRTMKQRVESEASASGNSQELSGDRVEKEMVKDLSSSSWNASHHREANSRTNASEEDVDAPLQSGVVRIFKQPGIEAPSDEDDFIEVRSKRQMLNDRREQREKEIKAKSRPTKPPHKQHASRPKDVVSRNYNKVPMPLGSEDAKSSQLDLASESPHFANNEVSTGYTAAASQPPIGTHPVSSDAQAIKSTQAGSVLAVSNGGAEHEPGVVIDSKNKVMSLSQSQVDEAMKPARYDSHTPTVGGDSSSVSGPILPKDKTFSSGASPINSLLAGEKIQFGAVTSPTVLPQSTRVVSHVIGAPGSNRPDAQMSRKFPLPQKDDSLYFSKEKHLADPLHDCEAEAAASAVAVAAISNDEIVGNGLGSVNDTKSFSAAGTNGITKGVVGDQHIASRSQSEELFSVSLPADLSVETALWPTLPSPQGSSSQVLSHLPPGPHSHFPFYEMNPMLGAPILAFSQNEDLSGAQSQPPKSSASAPPGPMSNWQQYHSGMDSFYGSPAGYPGSFIGPPRGIPGIQGPSHMVVYNHFAPYGQVSLSFMGATYIPSGKQADWNNNVPTSSVMHNGGEGDINNVNMSNVQRSGPNMKTPIQHLAPGSPLLPMPPPMPMFDVSPFQAAAPDLPVQARWGHIPTSPLHSIPVSRPMQQPQVEGSLPSQVNHGHPIDQSLSGNRFINSRTPTQSDNNNNRPSFTDTNAAPFPSQQGLADSSFIAVQTSSGSAKPESSKTDTAENSKPPNANPLKTQFPKKNMSTQQHSNNSTNNAGGYSYQRGGPMSHRNNNVGNDFSHRRMGYHGRNQSSGVDNKGFHTSKVKQIYVAKQTTTGGPAT
ncbi:hypothetical protein CASFOL_011458 [Castilleja foliolosa]|uniref:Uncharacterized protein n=1 Tax=Castilleja foliolosa TaxID=1961234 RepID=A0ABD3DVY3_9LAMI